jgi:diguanylate cyclase (GGDEF)-like protein/PAS domain S-box-containing protein
MLQIYNCIATEHDLRLVGLAALICLVASFAAVVLLHHARKSPGRMRAVWLVVSAVSTGFGIWATHFIAMLAYSPALPSGYNIVLTALSLFVAILLTAAGLAVSLVRGWRHGSWIGGGIVAGGIAAMHYTGMAAFEIQGVILWDATLVVASIVVGAVLGALALRVGLTADHAKWKLSGAILLTLAICSHHFTAMGAVSIIPDSSIEVSRLAFPAGWLAAGVAVASLVVIALALAGIMLDVRRHRSEHEIALMRDLANAAVEGLVICDRNQIVSVNTSFALLTGAHQQDVVSTNLGDWFQDKVAMLELLGNSGRSVETAVHHRDGSTTPVELILRPIEFGGRPHQVIAVRDLQSRRETEERIRFLAHHDVLTGLANRAHFNARLESEIASVAEGELLAVFCLDLDGFKEVNDLFGHAAGDRVLQTVATRIKAVLTDRQMVARLGGDEFAILAPGLHDAEAATRLAEAVLAVFQPENDKAEAAGVSTSIGIALFPRDGQDRETLVNCADIALYRAKAVGRGIFLSFESNMGVELRERQVLGHDLRHAAARGDLSIVYQPQWNVRTRTVTGFEALLRWNHPTRGPVSPSTFIPIAEETGSILDIGDWVLRTACREAATWTRPLTVAVNVSALQLYNPTFAQEVHQILLNTGLPARNLEIEITETALIADFNRAISTLRSLKALGIRVAMDDFGTGYSSLSNLRAFPFDKIKIDRSFTKSVHCNDQAGAIVRAVLGLGHGLNLSVSAEGVETPEELHFLQAEVCDEVQGYLIARPAPIGFFLDITHGHPEDGRQLISVA